MEEVTGQNVDAMAFCAQYPTTTSAPILRSQKTREKSRSGVITFGTHIFDPDIDHVIAVLVPRLGLTGFNGFQFIGKHLIEINPRVSSFIYTDDWCEPAYALDYYLGRSTALQLAKHQARYPIGAHLVRYFDCITNLTSRP